MTFKPEIGRWSLTCRPGFHVAVPTGKDCARIFSSESYMCSVKVRNVDSIVRMRELSEPGSDTY